MQGPNNWTTWYTDFTSVLSEHIWQTQNVHQIPLYKVLTSGEKSKTERKQITMKQNTARILAVIIGSEKAKY